MDCSRTSAIDNCSICMVALDCGEEPKKQLDCSHIFHRECIDEWTKRQPTCPLCKEILSPEPPQLPSQYVMVPEDVALLSLRKAIQYRRMMRALFPDFGSLCE